MNLNGIHKSHEDCNSYVFRKNEVVMDEPIYLGFAVLELSKSHMYETYYDKVQRYFWGEKSTLTIYGYDSFILSVNTNDIIRDLTKIRRHMFQ